MIVPVLIMEWRLGGGVLGYLVLSRRERAAQFRFGRLLEVHWIPPFRFALGARALGGAAEGECESERHPAAAARHYFTVNRTVSTTSGFRGMCFQFPTTATTRWGSGPGRDTITIAGTISTPVAWSTTLTGPLSVAPFAGDTILTVAWPVCPSAATGSSIAAPSKSLQMRMFT